MEINTYQQSIPKKGEQFDLLIEDISTESYGIAKPDNFVIFIPYALPGDRVKAIITKVKKKYAFAEISEISEFSPFRVIPECKHFGICNGCKLQNMSYKAQLEIKKNIVKNSLEKIGGFRDIQISDIRGSKHIFFYRNKLEYSFSTDPWLSIEEINTLKTNNNFALGYHIPGFIEKVIDIKSCMLQSEISDKILNFTRNFFKSRKIKPYSPINSDGSLRYLIIRQSAYTTDIMVNLITFDNDENTILDYSTELNKTVPEISSFIHSISTTKAQIADARNYSVVSGKGYIFEKLGKYRFKILPTTFFQTNSHQAEKLFNLITEIGEFEKDENVLDLYCGCGAISFFVSEFVKSVTGVELNQESVNSARENAEMNNIKNCMFLAGDVNKFLKNLYNTKGKSEYNTIIVDPPRSGLHPDVTINILKLQPRKIIYVSCNPSTQARDLRILSQKYILKSVVPVDMFPQTMHVENVVKMELKN